MLNLKFKMSTNHQYQVVGIFMRKINEREEI